MKKLLLIPVIMILSMGNSCFLWSPDVQTCMDMETDISGVLDTYNANCQYGPAEPGSQCAIYKEYMANQSQAASDLGCGGQTIQVFVR